MLVSKGDLFMILEFCGGGDLHKYYHTEEFTDDEFVRIVSELLSGVAYIHQRKMAHRDLKPANVRPQRERERAPSVRRRQFAISLRRVACHQLVRGAALVAGAPGSGIAARQDR